LPGKKKHRSSPKRKISIEEAKSVIKSLYKKNPDAILDIILDCYVFPQAIHLEEAYRRFEDDSPRGHVLVAFTKDMDGWVCIFSATPDPEDTHFSQRFRTPMIGGGQSPQTLEALKILAYAIKKDNISYPQKRGTSESTSTARGT